jgi:hypothetical protein
MKMRTGEELTACGSSSAEEAILAASEFDGG